MSQMMKMWINGGGRAFRKSREFKEKTRNLIPIKRWNLVRGDTVFIREGQDSGKTGVIKKISKKRNCVQVKGLKMRKHTVARSIDRPGYQYMSEGLIHYSNVQLVDPITNKPTRVKRSYVPETQEFVRLSQAGNVIPKPASLRDMEGRKRVANKITDTAAEDVLEVTYVPPQLPVRNVVPLTGESASTSSSATA